MSVQVSQDLQMRPYRNLAAAVLARAIKDIADVHTKPAERGQARRFLDGSMDSSTLRLWCTLLNISPGYLRAKIKDGDMEELAARLRGPLKANRNARGKRHE